MRGSLAILCLLIAGSCYASSTSSIWQAPSFYFPNLDAFGHVAFTQRLGDVRLAETSFLPAIVSFNSSSRKASKFLGEGWMFPALESFVVFSDERIITWFMPDGSTSYLARSKDDPSKFIGVNSWSAESSNENITCTNAAGWKLLYRKGKLYSLQFRDQPPAIISETDSSLSMQVNGKNLVSLEKSKIGAASLYIGSAKYTLTVENRPVIENLSGLNVVNRMTPSLTKIDNGVFKSLEIGYAPTDGLMPKITVTTPQKMMFFVWNPSTGTIVQDDQARYEVISGKLLTETAKIKREFDDGSWESYFLDLSKNEQHVHRRDGKEILYSFISFAPGKLALRKITSTTGGNSTLEYSAAFDEKGRLMREQDSGKTTRFNYDDLNRIVNVTLPSGLQLKNDYSSPKEVRKTLRLPGGASCDLSSKDGLWYDVYFSSEKTGFFSIRVASGDLDLYLPPQFKTTK